MLQAMPNNSSSVCIRDIRKGPNSAQLNCKAGNEVVYCVFLASLLKSKADYAHAYKMEDD